MARGFDAANASDSARAYLERYLALPALVRVTIYTECLYLQLCAIGML
jgi:hypothetical protein